MLHTVIVRDNDRIGDVLGASVVNDLLAATELAAQLRAADPHGQFVVTVKTAALPSELLAEVAEANPDTPEPELGESAQAKRTMRELEAGGWQRVSGGFIAEILEFLNPPRTAIEVVLPPPEDDDCAFVREDDGWRCTTHGCLLIAKTEPVMCASNPKSRAPVQRPDEPSQ